MIDWLLRHPIYFMPIFLALFFGGLDLLCRFHERKERMKSRRNNGN